MLLGFIAKLFTTTLATDVKKNSCGSRIFSYFTPSLTMLEIIGTISILMEGGCDKDHDYRTS